MDLPENAKAALWAWGFVDQAARNRWTTAQLWDAIKAAEPDNPRWRSLQFGAGLSKLRGVAGAMERARTELGRAAPDIAVTSAMVAEAPWSRSLAEQNVAPLFQVRVPITGTTRQGVEVTRDITVTYRGGLPTTVGQLIGEATDAAANRAFASDFMVTDAGVPQILTV